MISVENLIFLGVDIDCLISLLLDVLYLKFLDFMAVDHRISDICNYNIH